MNTVMALILSLIEGITEFLPISSTGHLILASQLLGVQQTEFVKNFAIAIQSGAILAVIVLYFRRLLKDFRLWILVGLAFIPTGLIGLVFYQLIKNYLLGNSQVVLVSLFLGGIVIIILEKIYQPTLLVPRHPESSNFPLKKPITKFEHVRIPYGFEAKFRKRLTSNRSSGKIKSLNRLTWRQAILIGLIQAISIIPGISRAAATIFGGLALGLDRQSAVEFSFLLAIPTMIVATGFDLLKTSFTFTAQEISLLTIGFIGAFITALITVKYLLKFIQHHNFVLFGYYRIFLAVIWWMAIS